jgi:hypothetical protein
LKDIFRGTGTTSAGINEMCFYIFLRFVDRRLANLKSGSYSGI